MNRKLLGTLFLLFIQVQTSAADAPECERIPYTSILHVIQSNPAAASGHEGAATRLTPFIRSRQPDVSPEQIELTLVLGEERVSLPVKSDGSFQLPLDSKWQSDDAWILTNQPQGTLSLSLQGYVSYGNLAAVRWRDTSHVKVSHLFPTAEIKHQAKETSRTEFRSAKTKISSPAIRIVELRHANDKASVSWLTDDKQEAIEKGANGYFTLSHSDVKDLMAAKVVLTPADGWSWRVKAKGEAWQEWAEIVVREPTID